MLEKIKAFLLELSTTSILEAYLVSDIEKATFELSHIRTCKNPKVVYEDFYIRISDFSFSLSSIKEGQIVKFVYKKIKNKKEEVIIDGPMFKILNVSCYPTFLNIVGVVEYENEEHWRLMHMCYLQAKQSNILLKKKGD